MTASPLQRATATAGLLALVPIAALLATEAITPRDAALRAVAVIAAITVITRVLRLAVGSLAGRMDRTSRTAATAEHRAAQTSSSGDGTRRDLTEAFDATARGAVSASESSQSAVRTG